MGDYYDAHCTKCGESTKADKLAFDFGEMVSKAIAKTVYREIAPNEKWEPLIGLDFRLYYRWSFLENTCKLVSGMYKPFVFTVKMLRYQLQSFSGTDFEELAKKDIDTKEYINLTKKIRFAGQQGQDVDKRELAAEIKKVVDLCSPKKSPNEDEVIAEFNVKVIMAADDCGNSFAKKLEIEYEDGRRELVTNNVCPNCGKVFYPEVGKYEEIIIVMAGSARVGKTAYLAALVDCLMNKKNGIASVVQSKNREWDFFRSTILEKFRKGEKIDKTAFEGGGETIPLFSVEINVLGKSYIFTFVDMPGEVFDNPEDYNSSQEDKGVGFILNERRIINHAKLIWFCVAPEQIDADIAKMKKFTNQKQDEVNAKTDEVMRNIRSTMESVNMDRKMTAAVMVTMSDQILGESTTDRLFSPDVDVCRDFIVNNSLNYQKTNEFCERSLKYLCEAREIVMAIDRIFGRYSVFAVAAYGKNLPQATQDELSLLDLIEQKNVTGITEKDFKPTPSMIELPFIWSLAALEKIPEVEQVPVFEERRKFPFGPRERIYVCDRWEPVSYEKRFQHYSEE